MKTAVFASILLSATSMAFAEQKATAPSTSDLQQKTDLLSSVLPAPVIAPVADTEPVASPEDKGVCVCWVWVPICYNSETNQPCS